jgi:hypothetical protein
MMRTGGASDGDTNTAPTNGRTFVELFEQHTGGGVMARRK